MANTIDELMRRPAIEWKGPKDPDFEQLIAYIRMERMKADSGKRAKRGEVGEKVDPKLLDIVLKGRGVKKPKTYRRY